MGNGPLSEHTTQVAEAYWAHHLGCSVEDFSRRGPLVISHGQELADYVGLFALFRGDAAIISVPPERHAALRTFFEWELSGNRSAVGQFVAAAQTLEGTLIGPAYIGYVDEPTFRDVPSAARPLDIRDKFPVEELAASCPSLEWEHGGSLIEEHPCSGLFIDGRLVALAGYELWGTSIAHIAVVTAPAFRGQGYGRQVVSRLTHHALSQGLVPQYRTLQSNVAAIHIAESLGFHPFGTSVAVRLHA